mmetsp:Transcript_80824/g.228841  ORF Transcript_80824/g.228841 Transcript_80824/m.228841 type:complete len:168 (-) Transcript_80824:115-618(-)
MRIFADVCLCALLLPGVFREAGALQRDDAGGERRRGEPNATERRPPSPAAAVQRPAGAEAQNATALARDEVWPFSNKEEYPTEFGCYWRVPTTCTRSDGRRFNARKWRHDKWAEHSVIRARARRADILDTAACSQRKSTWDSYCSSADAEMVYIPLPKSTYVPAYFR